MSKPQRRDGASFSRGSGASFAARGADPLVPPGTEWLTEDMAEALLTGPAASGEPPAGHAFTDGPARRLAELLAAARRLPDVVDPAAEEAALAAFRAAHPPASAPAAAVRTAAPDEPTVLVRRPAGGPRTGRLRRAAPRRVAVVALASVLALGGVTAAVAGAGRLSLLPGGGSGSGPVSTDPSAAVAPDGSTSAPAAPPGPRRTAPATRPAPTATHPASPTASPSAERSHTLAWCRTYLRGLAEHTAGATPRTTSYCRQLVEQSHNPGKDSGGSGDKSGDNSGTKDGGSGGSGDKGDSGDGDGHRSGPAARHQHSQKSAHRRAASVTLSARHAL